jgi:acyl carrier protein
MNRNEIIEKLTAVFHEVFSDNSIVLNDEMTANDVERWDSLTHMLMISTVEERFGVKFKLKELNKLKKVGDIIDSLQEKLG